MALTVYGIVKSRASRTLWMLEEIGEPYEWQKQDYRDASVREEPFLSLNPNGHIPVLTDEGIVVWESMATTLYLARKYGGPLAPQSLAEEADALRWSFWVVNECEKDALSVLFYRTLSPEKAGDPNPAVAAEKRLAAPMRVLDAHLSGRDYLAGDRFTVADLNVASIIAWLSNTPFLGGYSNVADWLKCCLARPAQLRVRELAE